MNKVKWEAKWKKFKLKKKYILYKYIYIKNCGVFNPKKNNK